MLKAWKEKKGKNPVYYDILGALRLKKYNSIWC